MIEKQYVVDTDGNKSAIILPIEEYEELLEDLHDLAVILERKSDDLVDHQDALKVIQGNEQPIKD